MRGRGVRDIVAATKQYIQMLNNVEHRLVFHGGLVDVFQARDIEGAVNEISTHIQNLIEFCKRSNVVLTVCSLPMVVDAKEGRDYRGTCRAVNRKIMQLVRAANYEYLSLEYIQDNPKAMAFDGVHYGEVGAVLAARPIGKRACDWHKVRPTIIKVVNAQVGYRATEHGRGTQTWNQQNQRSAPERRVPNTIFLGTRYGHVNEGQTVRYTGWDNRYRDIREMRGQHGYREEWDNRHRGKRDNGNSFSKERERIGAAEIKEALEVIRRLAISGIEGRR